MPRYLVRLQYLGTRYAGWQVQSNGRAIQQVVNEALSRAVRFPVKVEGSGRTDSGVHADAQWIHADIPAEIPVAGLVAALNAELPDDIRAVESHVVADDFHARFHARGKTYVYRIWNAPVADVFRHETHAWVSAPLDVEAMRSAAKDLVGHHDFRSFSVANPTVTTTWRTIHAIELEQHAQVLTLTVSGDGFLRFMVRRIAGLLIEIGKGRLEPSYAVRCIEPHHAPARWTAPPNGLTLVHVNYDGGTGSPDSPVLT